MIDFFKLSPRLSRIQYLSQLSIWAGIIGLAALAKSAHGPAALLLKPAGIIVAIVAVINVLFVKIRRLHDFNFSAWWIILTLIPVIGEVWLFFVLFIPGSFDMNRYGVPPRENTGSDYLYLLFAPVVYLILKSFGFSY